ncbi:MAG: hypothetical protein EA397_11865 [Deltaproteobacteria bacterium]|nr:MAG: hypothetical protein EA397_11865 [Deltaproteobacteria bacterium]
MVLGSLFIATSLAAQPTILIEAEVDPSLQAITGTMTLDQSGGVYLVDPLADLPDPPDDRTALRTQPGATERGTVRFRRTAENTWSFFALLPKRWGDIGVQPGKRLFANGGWYPQPLKDGRPVEALWAVSVKLPQGTAGTLGHSAGQEELAWLGLGDRVSLAVIQRGRITTLEQDDLTVHILSRRRPPRSWRKRLLPTLAEVRPPEVPLAISVVRAPLRRRLARPGAGSLFLSDRAWRLTPGLRRYHDPAISRAGLEAGLELPDPLARELAAATLTQHHMSARVGAQGVLRWLSWNPVIDAILNDRTLPFWADVFDRPHPDDPLRDDLREIYGGRSPATALAAQLRAHYGALPPYALGTGLTQGLSPREAAEVAEIDPALVEGWRRPYPSQDLRLSVDRSERSIQVDREAPRDAPAEVLELQIDQDRRTFLLGPGPDQIEVVLDEAPRRVVVDPVGLIEQRTRRGDAWPPRFAITSAAWLDAVNLTEGWASGFASVWARGRDDTRNVWGVGASANQQTLPSLSVSWLHRRGPLQDGLNRPHRFSIWAEPAWTNPRFAGGDRPLLTLGGGVAYAWDTRVSGLFPLRGRRLSVSLSGGVLPAESTRWGTARLHAAGVTSPHPRWALAGYANAAGAMGDTEQRLLWLGGPGAIMSLPPAYAIGRTRAVTGGEIRYAPVRHASLPLLGLAWLSEVQLSIGAEAGGATTLQRERVGAVGLTAGGSLVFDLLGASPSLVGVTLGRPVVLSGLPSTERVQVMVRFGQAF